MALVVEDGTGLVNADSYVSIAAADAYHTSVGTTAWAAAADPAKEIALRKATQYVDAHYNFRGDVYSATQALSWPRVGYGSSDVYETGSWPVSRLIRAVYELANVALSTSLYTNETSQVAIEQTVGPITVKYGQARFGGQVRYSFVDDLLKPLTSGGGRHSVRVERVS